MKAMSDYIKVGNRCCVLGAGHDGTITKITKAGEVWVKVRSRWGNLHHPVTAKTFRYPRERIAPIECSPNHRPDGR